MRTYDEILADASDSAAFSNGSQGYSWTYNNCDRCINDKPAREGGYEDGCPILLVTLMSKTPAEFLGDRVFADYTCVEFRDEDSGPSPEPKPVPDPPGQGLLLDREPFEATRMFVQPADAVVAS